MNGKMLPALVAGVAAGVLSSLPGVNLALCVWMWLGGVFAVVLYRLGGASKMTRAEGALLGLLAGTVAGVITVGFTLAGMSVFTDVLQPVQPSADAEPVQRALRALEASGVLATLTGCLSLGLHMGLGALGGVIGVGSGRSVKLH